MQNHNTAGKRHDSNRPSQGSQASHKPQNHMAGVVRMQIPTTFTVGKPNPQDRPRGQVSREDPGAKNRSEVPTTVSAAVRQYEREPLGYVRLRGYGSNGYMTFGRALVIVHPDDTVTIDAVVLPFQAGAIERCFSLRPKNLREDGDHYEVISIFKMVSGVWFVRQQAQGYHPRGTSEQPARHYFPMIREHLDDDTRRGERLLNQLTTFTGIQFGLEDMAEHRQYVELPLGIYHDMHELVNDERVAAARSVERDDIKLADSLFTCMQQTAGYTMTPSARRARIDDPEQVAATNATVAPRLREERVDAIADVATEHAATMPAPPVVVVQPVTKRPAWMTASRQ